MPESNIGKNIWYTSVSTLIPSIFTYLFWLVTGRIAGPEAVGLASSLTAFTIIIVTIMSIDSSIGMKRYLGIAASINDLGRFRQILTSTVIFVTLTIAVTAVWLAEPSLSILESFNIDRDYYWVVLVLIASMAFNNVLTEALISALQSKALLSPLIFGSIFRFPIIFILFYVLESTNLAVILAYSSLYIFSTVFYALHLRRFLRTATSNLFAGFGNTLRHVLSAGLVGWIPHTINVLGSQLSILTIFSVAGSAQAGMFYVPQAIFNFVTFLIVGITKVSHPLIAGMVSKDDQANLLRHTLNLAYITTIPITVSVFFFAGDYLSLVGEQFRSGNITLSIFMANVPLTIITEIIYYFVYGKGDNRMILYLGLVGNAPRIILYFILIPFMGSSGAAAAYSVGSVCQTVLSIMIMRKKYLLNLHYKTYLTITVITFLTGLVTWLIGMHFILSFFTIIASSLLIYTYLHIFTEVEYETILFSILPNSSAKRIYPIGRVLIEKISRRNKRLE